MIETVNFKGTDYPLFQTNGNAARFCRAFALEVCKGDVIYDIGYNREEWKFPNAIGVDLLDNNEFDAYNLPPFQADAIHSSHLLEHLQDWVAALNYWTDKLKSGGTLFLYLPDESQLYWRPFHNRKHVTQFNPSIIRDYLFYSGRYKNIFVSGVDAYNSFIAFAEKI